MEKGLKSNLCHLDLDNMEQYHDDAIQELLVTKVPPSVRYACEFWLLHAFESETVDEEEPVSQWNIDWLAWLEIVYLMDSNDVLIMEAIERAARFSDDVVGLCFFPRLAALASLTIFG
jgi:rubrerythrin